MVIEISCNMHIFLYKNMAFQNVKYHVLLYKMNAKHYILRIINIPSEILFVYDLLCTNKTPWTYITCRVFCYQKLLSKLKQ